MGHIKGKVFVAPVDTWPTLLVDTQPYGYFIKMLPETEINHSLGAKMVKPINQATYVFKTFVKWAADSSELSC